MQQEANKEKKLKNIFKKQHPGAPTKFDPRQHSTYSEIRFAPRFTSTHQTALVRTRAGVARQLKTLAAD